MRSAFAITIAACYGLSVRLLFGFLDGFMQIMGMTFLALIPFLIGFLTIILLPKDKKIGPGTAFFMPWLTSFLLLLITMALNIEGAICWVMVYPFFAAVAGLGGITAFYVRKYYAKKRNGSDNNDQINSGKPNTLQISALFLIPLFIGFIEGDSVSGPEELYLKREIILNASPETIWKELISNKSGADEKQTSVSNALGFPRHVRTVMDKAAVGGKRIAVYEKGLYFLETISKCEPGKILILQIKTDPSKIPPTVMDEHIIIGGKHLNILEDVYKLENLPDGKTRLSLASHFYINTPFNWYAGMWAKYLMSDIIEAELNLVEKNIRKNK